MVSKEALEFAMNIHEQLVSQTARIDNVDYDLIDLCQEGGSTCLNATKQPVCSCLINSVLKMWNYDMEELRNDPDVLATLQNYGSRDDLETVLGKTDFDESGNLIFAQALALNYFLKDRSVVENGSEVDPINEGWEEQVFLKVVDDASANSDPINVNYLATRSFGDEFGSAITGDLTLVQVSYIVIFVFMGATMGKIKCGTGSRWTMAIAALVMVGISTAAGYGASSLFGLTYGPVHSLLPFVLLGIGA
jgi:hypothetical protein